MKNNSKHKKPKSLNEIEKETRKFLHRKYRTDETTYQKKAITEIIFNEKTKLVALFKDYLILDDSTEFIRRFYNKTENISRLNKIIAFYEAYSKIFPNYIIIPESKYLYKNIRRKQKMIDAFYQIKLEEEENRKLNNVVKKSKKGDNFFDSEIRKSILRYQPSYNYYNNTSMSRSQISLHSTTNICNNSITLSLNLHKNIYENEESILSIENILNVIDRKGCGKGFNLKTTDTVIENEVVKIDSKNKLNTLLTDSIYRTKNFNGQPTMMSTLSNRKLLVKSPTSEDQNTNICNNYPINEKTVMKMLHLKQLKINTDTLMNQSDKRTEPSSLITSPTIERKKTATHRVSTSIPELGNNVKIINNYPNIIIPNTSTHVSINQNYYNYGTGGTFQSPIGSRIIMIEHFDSTKTNLPSNNTNNKLNQQVKERLDKIGKLKYENFSTSPNNNSSNLRRTNTLTKEIPTQKINFIKTGNTNTNITKAYAVKTNTNINTEGNHKSNTQQIYSKVLKIFQDNLKTQPSTTSSYKTIDNNKKLFERAISKKRRERNDNETLRGGDSNILKVTNYIQETLETEREGAKSRLETREAYKTFLEKNKLECLTARNSLDKISSTYKILNSDSTNSINKKLLSLNQNNPILNNFTQKSYHYKKNICLSPTPNAGDKHRFPATTTQNSIKKDQTPFKKTFNKVTTPVKFSSKKVFASNKEELEKAEKIEKLPSKTTKKDIPKLTPIDLLSNTLQAQYKTIGNTKVKTARGTIKSLDFNTLKNFKK